MAATEATAIPPIEAGKSVVEEEKVEKVEKSAEKLTKVEKPDDEKFKKDLAEAEKTLIGVNEKLSALKIKLDGSSGKGPNSARIADLRKQLDEIKEKQAEMKSGKAGVQQQLDAVKAKIEREQNDLKARRGKINYRSTDEIDREIKDLEREVDSGKLKLVDEKKNLKRISDLKALRKQLSVFTSAEESIKSDITKRKQLQEELSSSNQTPEAKALSEEYNKVRDEMNKLKAENDEAYNKRGELRGQRDELQKERDRAYEGKKNVQDEYYKQRDAYRAWNEQVRKAQSERYWKQREDEEKARIAHNSSIRLEEASQDAFATQIWKCENLLGLFGSGEGLPPSTPKPTSTTIPAAPQARTVETSGLTKMTSKKDREAEEFLAGAGKKKTKTPKQSSSKTVKPKGFVLSMDVMQTLGELGVSLPTSGENVKNTVEELKGKLSYFKENQGRVTKENIAKANKDNEDYERKTLASFNEKKEADLSGKRNSNRNTKSKSNTSTPNKGKGKAEKESKEKVNGSHAVETKTENGVESAEANGDEVAETS